MRKISPLINQRVFVLIMTLLSMNVFAQLPMTRSIFTDPFVPISTDQGATLSTAIGDDAVQAAIPVGFDFDYLGTLYNTLTVCTNGWASFTATANSTTNTNLYTATVPNAVLAPWFDDLISDSILYQLTGAPGAQVFIMQWHNQSYWSASGRPIVFQLKLYEGTNEIEFCYDLTPLTGTKNNSESASIGINSPTGGVGQYLDAVTGSHTVGNATLQTNRWPKYNFRFTPGAPSPIAGGSYDVGTGQFFPTLNEAVAELNHKGMTGPVTLNLTDAVYDTTTNFFPILIGPVSSAANTLSITSPGAPATISYTGTTSGSVANATSTTSLGTTTEPIIGLVGADYVSISNLIIESPLGVADRAISLSNLSATDGAQNNLFENLTISMNRGNTSSRGFGSSVPTTPSAASGTNSNNIFRDFSITNVYGGIQLTANATNPDVNNVITNSVCTNFNNIGDPATPNDIGFATTATYGINFSNQSDFTISNCRISNVTNNGGQADGINIGTFKGICNINNNIIDGIRNAGATSTTFASGIRATHTTTGTHSIRIFNNSISGISSGYTGTVSTSRTIRGINISGTGGSTTQTYEIFNNSVSLDGSSSPNISSVCLEIATTSGPVFSISNNAFANLTTGQSGVARHFVYRSTSATSFGNTGTLSDHNDLFILDDQGVTGFVGQGNTTNYATLGDWQTAMTQDANSISVNPNFISASDLHATNLALNGVGTAYPSYLTQDLDCNPRIPDNDLGAYTLTGCSGTPTAGTIDGLSSLCSGDGTTLNLNGASTDAGVTYQWGVSTTPGGPYTNLGTTNVELTGPLTVPTYYIVTVTCSLNGQSAVTTEKSVLIDAIPTISVSPATSDFCLPAGGTANLTASGNSVSYSWSPASGLSTTTGTDVDASPSATTVYTVVGTAANGCTASTTATVNLNLTPSITTVTASPSDVCVGGNSQLEVQAALPSVLITEVTIFRTGTGATSPYPAYATGQDLVEISNISSGPVDISGYVISAFGDNSATASHTLTFPAGTIIPANSVSIICLGTGTDSPADLYFNTGGTSDSYFSSSKIGVVLYNGTSIVDAVGLGANVTTGTYTFNAATGVTASDWTGAAPSGSGLAGSIRNAATDANSGTDWTQSSTTLPQTIGTYNALYASPGTISYAWSPAVNLDNGAIANPFASNILSNTVYTVTATSNGCSDTASVSVTAGLPLTAAASTATPVVCEAVDVTLEAVPTGGGGPYSYSWSGPASFSSSDQNPVLVSVLASMGGTYFVTITDNCGSTATASTTLTINPIPVLTLTPSSATYCSPGGDPINMTASGADTYNWSPVSGLSSSVDPVVDATPATSTTYTVIGTNTASGCTTSLSSVITVAPAVTITSASATPSTTCSGSNSQLNVIAPSLAVRDYIFNSNAGGLLQDMTGSTQLIGSGVDDTPTPTPSNIGFTFNFNGVAYTQFSVSPDGWLLLGSGTATNDFSNTLTDNTNIPKLYPYWDDLATGTDGSVRYLLTGTAPNRILVVEWFVTIPRNTTGAANSTFQGWLYEDGTVQFVYGSMNSGSMTASVGLTESSTNFNCVTVATNSNSNSVANNNNSGQPANGTIYSFVPPSYTYSWSPATFLNSTSVSNPTITAITSTTVYTVTVSAGGCSETADVTVTIANPLTTAVPTDATCLAADGSATASSTDGATPYSFVWSDGQTDATAVGLVSGTYSVTSTDASGCESTATVSVGSTAGNVTLATSSTPSTCSAADGTASVTASNGLAPYTYLWSDGQTDVTATGLLSGSYDITVTDANGCEAIESATVTVGAGTLTASAGSTDATCTASNGTASVTIVGGTSPYTTLWSNGATDAIITGLSAGSYSVTVNDNNGCQDIVSVTVSSNSGTLAQTTSATDAVCTANNGTVTVNTTGGTTPYSYIWSNGATDAIVSGLAAGTYDVTVSDANGCESSGSAIVAINNGNLVATATSTDALCLASDGSVNVTTTGGTAPFTYLWSNGDVNASVSGLAAGTYDVTVTDVNGCESSANVSVGTNSGNLSATASTTDATCLSLDGTATLTVSNGLAPFTYIWSDGQTDATATGLGTGIYDVTVVDANGCETSVQATVNVNSGTLSVTASSTDAICTNNNGSVVATATGGTAPFTFIWDNSASGDSLSNLAAGDYVVSVADANGCIASASVTIGNDPGNLSVTITTSDATVIGASDGSADATISGGTAPFTYLWSNGETTEDISALLAGNYTVTVTDANGCESVESATVNNPPSSLILSAETMSINLFPNPASEQTMVAVELESSGNVRIRLINALGQIIQSDEYSDVKTLQHLINLSDLPSATYLVEVSANGVIKTHRLAVNRQ